MISFNLSQIKSFVIFYGNILAIRVSSSDLSEKLRDFKASLWVSDCFSKAFSKEECVNLTFSIIWLWPKGNVYSPVRNSYLLIFPDDIVDIFAASLFIS